MAESSSDGLEQSREDLIAKQKELLRKRKGASTKIVANDLRPTSSSGMRKPPSTSDLARAGPLDEPAPAKKTVSRLFDEDIPDEPLPATEVKVSAFAQRMKEQGIDDVYEPSDKRFQVSPGSVPSALPGAVPSATLQTAAPPSAPTGAPRDPRIASLFFENLETFVSSPAPKDMKVQCVVLRQKVGSDFVYTLKLERPEDGRIHQVFLLAGCKRKSGASANYAISTVEDVTKDTDVFLAKLKSNFVGTQFTVFDGGVNPTKVADPAQKIRTEMAAVIYELNPLGFKGPRKMTVLIPTIDPSSQLSHVFAPTTEAEGLLGQHKASNMVNMLELINKSPVWNEATQSFVLNFYGRVTLASVKNFQIIHANDPNYVILQFGRVAENMFTMDYQYPMSALQAFGIVLSSFDGKIACE
eukprot:m.660708 g.660708  ORF g.660708 m.660708 type:complete len:413 (-) comp58456_c0_seq2:120-1358(-)